MINFIIRLIKKIPFLYNLANKIVKKIKKKGVSPKSTTNIIYYGYILKNLDELLIIKEKYKNLQKHNTKLLVLVDNSKCNILMHKLIRENPKTNFASSDYFEKYHAKLSDRIVWLNYTEEDSKLLDFLA